MAIFNSYVKLPEGISHEHVDIFLDVYWQVWLSHHHLILLFRASQKHAQRNMFAKYLHVQKRED